MPSRSHHPVADPHGKPARGHLEYTDAITSTISRGEPVPVAESHTFKAGTVLSAKLPEKLAPGTYRVHWAAVGVDSHPRAADAGGGRAADAGGGRAAGTFAELSLDGLGRISTETLVGPKIIFQRRFLYP